MHRKAHRTLERWRPRTDPTQATRAVFEYVERFYGPIRPRSALRDLSSTGVQDKKGLEDVA